MSPLKNGMSESRPPPRVTRSRTRVSVAAALACHSSEVTKRKESFRGEVDAEWEASRMLLDPFNDFIVSGFFTDQVICLGSGEGILTSAFSSELSMVLKFC